MLELIQIPCLTDNYAWLVVDGAQALVVDPSEAAPVLERLRAAGARLAAVLVTHHHADHVGGVEELVAATGCAVVGNARDGGRIPGLSRRVDPGQTTVVAGLPLEVLDTSGHTLGHVAYACARRFDVVRRHGHAGVETDSERLAGRPALFVGDALFGAGCGRLFEGTKAMLTQALRTLAARNPAALVCCAHEYTAANLRFARQVLPANAAIAARAAHLDDELGPARSTVPSTLALELETNPFLLALAAADAVGAVGELRARRDAFAG
ncbi:MAG: hydroxyacylglutathione hydrolase [Deltaproteobacteria bacterium RBG_16_71_12]|nr:MAG: hydroxyacylglutathione hydrolase [Deltaproteobacteria bacterium RBG_16_71_12]